MRNKVEHRCTMPGDLVGVEELDFSSCCDLAGAGFSCSELGASAGGVASKCYNSEIIKTALLDSLSKSDLELLSQDLSRRVKDSILHLWADSPAPRYVIDIPQDKDEGKPSK